MRNVKNTKRFDVGYNEPSVSRYMNEGSVDRMDPSKDERLVRETREAIDKEESISEKGRRVQVTARNGVITLEGDVFTESERMTIGDKAAAVAGFGKVHNLLCVRED